MNSFDKLKAKLAELFQLDQADLDFGIYRIMNAKREEITRFLERDLLPQVREALAEYKSGDKAEIQKELQEAIQQAKDLGADPDTLPKVRELREKLKEAVDITALENEVYDHLYSFFSRYYDEGDFISLRRYKEGVYAIPYEGEEVKLYWANHDQYYIKTTEYLRDYAFRMGDGRRVHFKIVEADTEKDNIKVANGKNRRFAYRNLAVEDSGELSFHFEYKPFEKTTKQANLNKEAVERMIADLRALSLSAESEALRSRVIAAEKFLTAKAPTEKNPNRTILEKHLSDYTKRNTFDYFIHKDLGGFLRRELDFYIKNEVMHLDDVENAAVPQVEQYLSKIKAIRRIAHKIIDFLEQLENFQKKLWLKKKFVTETNYCVTLDRVPEEFYPEIAANEAQREEWVRLFAINEIKKDLTMPGYSEPLTVAFLKANSHLVLDTKHFSEAFKWRLIAAMDDIDEQCDGVLVHSENFQALNLMLERYREQVKCIYIDPPYNSPSSEILYKNDYKHSSWLSLLFDRINITHDMLNGGTYIIAIDENEQERFGLLLDVTWLHNYRKVCVTVRHNPRGIQGKNFSHCHEYAYFLYPSDAKKYIGERHLETPDVRNLRDSGLESDRTDAKNCFYPFIVKDGVIESIGEIPPDNFHPSTINEMKPDGKVFVWPIDTKGREKKWRYARQSVEKILPKLQVRETRGKYEIYFSKDTGTVRTLWDEAQFDASEYGTKLLQEIFGTRDLDFSYPKSLYTLIETIRVTTNSLGKLNVMDYFAGSGTTAHAVINLNREDDGKRKYILAEMGNYFDTVLVPRIKKVVYAKDWKNGKPTSRDTGISHMFKYIRLESYEDALANLVLKRTPAQQKALFPPEDSRGASAVKKFRESYMLKYMLETEAKGSPSLLNIDGFDDPFSYKLLVGTGSVGETRPVTVDLVETFNWLLGLRVRHMASIRGFRIVEGTNPKREKVLVIWRKIRDLTAESAEKIMEQRQKANEELDEFFRKQQYNTLDSEFDVIYVNGDNNLMNIPLAPERKGLAPRYKVRLIEEEFKRLMFEIRDV